MLGGEIGGEIGLKISLRFPNVYNGDYIDDDTMLYSIVPNSRRQPQDRRTSILGTVIIRNLTDKKSIVSFLVIADNRFITTRWRNSQVSQVDKYTR